MNVGLGLQRKHIYETLMEKLTNPDERQVGGDHYKNLKVQPWDAMESWLTKEEFVGFLKGNIIKYLARAHTDKEPHDLMIGKAQHYQDKLAKVLANEGK